ncbi:hypothetical protein [Sporosarcina ureae]|uniref:hypothetical protein n=1 Tax=Sporosarcina ureae TaxID=1571 RepID=UPI0026EE8BFF|nr:hypothetical protein [Sporosarcina ureae]
MKLLNVRKGQFVYYKNKLHKVYSIKTLLQKSVHLIRLEDYEQELATARSIDYYKPRHLDSFVFLKKRYTLDQDVKAKVGDYILVINPKPDLLDFHHLHAIELVSSIEKNGIVSSKSNGIKHHEYWVMVPGLMEGATTIDLQNPVVDVVDEHVLNEEEAELSETHIPKVGDVYQKNDSVPFYAMIVAIKGEIVFLGGNVEVEMSELIDNEEWRYVPSIVN